MATDIEKRCVSWITWVGSQCNYMYTHKKEAEGIFDIDIEREDGHRGKSDVKMRQI